MPPYALCFVSYCMIDFGLVNTKVYALKFFHCPVHGSKKKEYLFKE